MLGQATIPTPIPILYRERKQRFIIPYQSILKELARQLRNGSTKSEIMLWKYLKARFLGKYDFHRQKP
jgi:very-short-patch-repair endonuclease